MNIYILRNGGGRTAGGDAETVGSRQWTSSAALGDIED
jgi:hypothetical protein